MLPHLTELVPDLAQAVYHGLQRLSVYLEGSHVLPHFTELVPDLAQAVYHGLQRLSVYLEVHGSAARHFVGASGEILHIQLDYHARLLHAIYLQF